MLEETAEIGKPEHYLLNNKIFPGNKSEEVKDKVLEEVKAKREEKKQRKADKAREKEETEAKKRNEVRERHNASSSGNKTAGKEVVNSGGQERVVNPGLNPQPSTSTHPNPTVQGGRGASGASGASGAEAGDVTKQAENMMKLLEMVNKKNQDTLNQVAKYSDQMDLDTEEDSDSDL